MGKRQPPGSLAALRKYADALEPRARGAFLRSMEAARDDVNIRALERAIELGDRDAALQAIRLGEIATRLPQVSRVLDAAFEAAGKLTAADLEMDFSLLNPHTAAAAGENAARLVVEVSDETRAAIRAAIVRAFREGLAPADTARLIRSMVGLTERQAQAVLNYRGALAEDERPQAQIERMAQRYADKLLRQRSETIARTEIINASTQGTLAAWSEAQDAGLLPPAAETRKIWIVTDDDRLCPDCNDMDGQSVGLEEPFVAPGGEEVDGPALHPNCRCTIGLDFPS